jgi:hypothetical protein
MTRSEHLALAAAYDRIHCYWHAGQERAKAARAPETEPATAQEPTPMPEANPTFEEIMAEPYEPEPTPAVTEVPPTAPDPEPVEDTIVSTCRARGCENGAITHVTGERYDCANCGGTGYKKRKRRSDANKPRPKTGAAPVVLDATPVTPLAVLRSETAIEVTPAEAALIDCAFAASDLLGDLGDEPAARLAAWQRAAHQAPQRLAAVQAQARTPARAQRLAR